LLQNPHVPFEWKVLFSVALFLIFIVLGRIATKDMEEKKNAVSWDVPIYWSMIKNE
jgi:hypothetical protein